MGTGDRGTGMAAWGQGAQPTHTGHCSRAGVWDVWYPTSPLPKDPKCGRIWLCLRGHTVLSSPSPTPCPPIARSHCQVPFPGPSQAPSFQHAGWIPARLGRFPQCQHQSVGSQQAPAVFQPQPQPQPWPSCSSCPQFSAVPCQPGVNPSHASHGSGSVSSQQNRGAQQRKGKQ